MNTRHVDKITGKARYKTPIRNRKKLEIPPELHPLSSPFSLKFSTADDEFETLILSQRQGLMATRSTDSDLDLAYRLQLQEAMAASLAHQPSSSISPHPSASPTETIDLDRFKISQLEMNRRSHDEKFAERPVRVYFKGMESDEVVKGRTVKLAGVGVAICDQRDRVVMKISKPLDEVVKCREAVEMKALIEALNMVVRLGVKKVHVFLDFRTLYNHLTGKWMVKQHKVANLISEVQLLQKNFNDYNVFLVPRCKVKFAFKLARDAIDSQLTKNVELNGNVKESCIICLEDNEPSHMFAVDECLHRFCFSCIKQHVEAKLLHGLLPACPHEGCKVRLNVESCSKFLTPNLLNIMIQRIKEESIPVTQKIYCPYPKCSALMSLNEAIRPQRGSSSKQPAYGTSGLRKCVQCNGSFCIKCKVPWHDRMSCSVYKRLSPQNHGEEVKLKALARQKLWRQCVKCNHMIELAEGCFHMTCRCGYEFCYTCGAEWRDKKATCSCPLFDEQNILYDYSDEESDDYYDDEGYDDYEEYEDYTEYADYSNFVMRLLAQFRP